MKNKPLTNQEPGTRNKEPNQHGGARPGAGKPKKTHATKKVTVELHESLAQKWADHCAKLDISKPESIAKLVKWKKPKS